MLFHDSYFLFVFLPLVFLVFGILSLFKNRVWSAAWLALSSIVFYSIGSWGHLILFLGSIIANFLLSKRILQSADAGRKKVLFISGISLNLGILFIFKYLNFATGSLADFLGLPIELPAFALPLAISFFTFQQIAYLAMVHRSNELKANFLEYTLYIAFFPQLIAGPIVRPEEMIPQIQKQSFGSLNSQNISLGISLLIIGLAKKLLLADNLAQIADPFFALSAQGEGLSAIEAWIALIGFGLQIYFDFSAYSDMALGLARCFNLWLPENFASPYRSLSIIDFWRRWHITLSTFLRDFLYIPLGGNRCSKLRTSTNLLATMLLAGLWHGANWTFVIWGGLHGVFLIINHQWRRFGFRLPSLISWAISFMSIMLAWVFFRSENIHTSITFFANLWGSESLYPNENSFLGYIKTLPLSGQWNPLHYAIHFLNLYPPVQDGLHLGMVFFSQPSVSIMTISIALFVTLAMPRPLSWLTNPINKDAKLNTPAALIIGVLAAILIASLGNYQATQFIYFRF